MQANQCELNCAKPMSSLSWLTNRHVGPYQKQINSLDTFHEEQLHFLLGVFYPDHISNKALYECTHSEPMHRWLSMHNGRYLDTYMRIPLTVPANKAPMTAFISRPGAGRRGRPWTILQTVLNDDPKGSYHIWMEVEEGLGVTADNSTCTGKMEQLMWTCH